MGDNTGSNPRWGRQRRRAAALVAAPCRTRLFGFTSCGLWSSAGKPVPAARGSFHCLIDFHPPLPSNAGIPNPTSPLPAATSFSRTLRALNDDAPRHLRGVAVALALLAAWIVWALAGRVSI